MAGRLLATAAALGLTLGLSIAAPAAQANAGSPDGAHRGDWVGSWEAAPAQDTADTFTNTTIRNVVHLSVGGSAVRVRLSNKFGTRPLVLGRVTVARQAPGPNSPNVQPGTLREATFADRRTVTVAPGADVRSDPVPLSVPDQANLLITVYLPAPGSPVGSVTFHGLAEQTSFLSRDGDHAADRSGTAFTAETSSWFYLTGVDTVSRSAHHSVVALGDSITDGYLSTYGANHRWPDLLANRVLARPAGPRVGVLNAGISGNRLLLPGNPAVFGPSAQDRLGEDVLSRTAARTVIVFEGINDIQQTPHQTDPAAIVGAIRTIADRAHAHGLRVLVGTVAPFEGWQVYDATLEAVRLSVNAQLRAEHVFDGVFDFDAALRDPADPHRMLPAFDSGDHLHPNDAGYQAIADAVNLHQL
jgi:lysophospholipase L1-like esterase